MPPTSRAPSSIEVQTRAMFTRVLSTWALDVLRLRRSGLMVPGHRQPSRPIHTPRFGGEPEAATWWNAHAVASALRWNTQARVA